MLYNTIGRTKSFKHIRSKFTTSISSQNSYFGVKLIFYYSFKVIENFKNIKLELQKKKLGKFGVIINKQNIILKIIDRGSGCWTPNIRVNKFKWLEALKSDLSKVN